MNIVPNLDRRSLLKGVSLCAGGILLAPLLQKIAAAAEGNAMNQTVMTTATKRVLSAVALATLWLAGAAGGFAAEPPTGPTYTNSLGMALVRFNAGAFVMGEGTNASIPETKAGSLDWDEQPAHPVVLTTPFYVLTVRVSKAQFDQAGLGSVPGDGRVSWNRAAAFCAWLSQKEGLTYRLPTEAEWEYVRRNPGTVTDFEGEWVSDWHGAYRNVSLTDPAGPLTGMMKVIRADATNRLCQPPSLEGKATFRVVLDTAPTTRFVYTPLPFNQMAVKQSTAPALQGPDPKKPYFNARFATPAGKSLKAMGVDPAFDPGHLHHSALEIMPNGDVLAAWFCSDLGVEYGPNVRIVQVRLRYGAEEFDLQELFIKAKWDDEQDISPCLWRDGTTNWLFTGWSKTKLFRVSRSTDCGATWTTIVPEFLSTNGYYQPINSAFRAPDGTLYVPVDMPFPALNSALFRSSDNGLTWTNQPGLTTSGRHSTIVPLDQTGRLLSLGGKGGGGYMPQNISTNWGATWEKNTPTPFPGLGSGQRPSVCRLASGKLVMVGDAGYGGNPPSGWTNGPAPYVALSADNGATWHIKPLPVALKKRNQYYTIGYTTVRGAPNGLIHVVSSLTTPAVHYEFNEAWVYSAEGDITPETGGGSITNYSENYPGGARKATWSARICPNGRYLLDGVETNYYENGTVQRVATWASGRRTGEETLWMSNGRKFWSWNHDLTNNVSTWTHWWSNGRKRLESQWDTNPTVPDLPNRHFRGLMASGNAWGWDPDGRSVNTIDFPACEIISPTNGTRVYAGTTVSIAAAAASVNSDITNMVCSVDRVPVGSSTNGLFTFDWPATAASVGSHVISVTALDRGGRTANASVGIRVLSRVACAITTPADLAVVDVGTNVTLAATASSLDAGISKVEFFVNGAKIGEDATAPYSCLWTNVPIGNYVLTARATDVKAQTGVSDAVMLMATASWDGAKATGGTVKNYTVNGVNCTAHIFTNSGKLTVTAGGTVEVLVVGGGGGGGGGDNGSGAGGGGGAGGLRYTNLAVTPGSYAVTVGAGGAGGVANGNNASAGSNSAFGALIALGGGRGDRTVATSAGGSGAGGFGRGMAGGSATQPGSASGGYGHAGGNSASNPGGGGGGGGAGSVGSSGGAADGGNGGSGFATFLSGSSMTYAGGGGGGCQSGLMYGTATAGGGDGGAYRANGTHATSNTGGGGGGGGVHGGSGGNGGSGIVIVWYVTGGKK